MALSDRTRRKHVVAAQKHLPPGTYVTGYARGFGGAYPPLAVGGVIAALIAASVLLSVLLRGVFFPGVLLIAVLIQAVRPGRGLVVAQQGLALFNHGFWTAKPPGGRFWSRSVRSWRSSSGGATPGCR